MTYNRFIILLLVLVSSLTYGQVVKVEVVNQGGAWTFLRDGKPYYVKGAGGHVHLDKLVEIGGNSIRTWSLDNAKEYLDEAHERGLTVMMGLWMGHERHGFDYNNEKAVRQQLEYFKTKVKELKNHPALLMWGIGNEVDLFYSNTKVWDAVQDVAAMIHREDPNHPTSTVTAGLDSMEVQLIKQKAPDIDVYCVNTYGDLASALKNIQSFGWNGPYMITEWGPNGHWEVSKTPWNVPLEQTSSEKAQSYYERYQLIENRKSHCLGSYLFLWGQKQETTTTWYGVFDKKGNATEALNIMHRYWTNGEPVNRAPIVGDVGAVVDGTLKRHYQLEETDQSVLFRIQLEDPDNDNLKVVWKLIPESTDIKAGGDQEKEPTEIFGAITKTSLTEAKLKLPDSPGAYRVYVFVYDRNGHVAYGNVPIYVPKVPEKKSWIKLKSQSLKFEY